LQATLIIVGERLARAPQVALWTLVPEISPMVGSDGFSVAFGSPHVIGHATAGEYNSAIGKGSNEHTNDTYCGLSANKPQVANTAF